MNDVFQIRLTTVEKERLKEMANERGITVSELILTALKIKRRKRVKPRSIESKNIIQQAA